MVSSSSSNAPFMIGVSSRQDFQSYFVYMDGSFIEAELDKKPEFIGGQGSIYNNIHYPPSAREHGIQGTVIITIIVNELGQLEDANIASNVGGGCDEEGLRVIKLNGEQGFVPAEIKGIPVKVKYDISISFVLLKRK